MMAKNLSRFVFALASISLAACPETGGSAVPEWLTVLDSNDLDGTMLSLWGDPATGTLFAAGGPLGNPGYESIALRYDGASWSRLPLGGPHTFWWVAGTSPSDVWFVGTSGRISHWDGAAFEEFDSGTSATLWGAIAFGPNDVWVVGGTPGPAEGDDDVLLHYDGVWFAPVALPGAPLGRALNKVWGTSSDDLYVVGEAGTIWHKVGPDFVLESDPPVATGNLLTVHGCSASDVYAVGGADVLHSTGDGAWQKVNVSLTNVVNGVACAGPGEVAIVGGGGQKQRLVGGVWKSEFTKQPTDDLHGVFGFAGAEGPTFWVAGGDFFSLPSSTRREGVIGRYGAGTVALSVP